LIVLPDVNVLVYAFRREYPRHEEYAAWLTDVVGGADEVGISEGTLAGFVRIVTSARIYADPAPTADALAFVGAVRRSARSRWVTVNETVWTTFAALAGSDPQVRGNLIPDAWLAALALAHGCRLATADRGFARFDGLEWFDPVRRPS
jgi:toxin-antitoxin system PIN domain toxin